MTIDGCVAPHTLGVAGRRNGIKSRTIIWVSLCSARNSLIRVYQPVVAARPSSSFCVLEGLVGHPRNMSSWREKVLFDTVLFVSPVLHTCSLAVQYTSNIVQQYSSSRIL